MNRAQRRIIRDALPASYTIPGPGAIWLLYVLCVAALLKYLI